jgi:Holliday junction resolvasome RuvABC endonuclease subunit
MKETSVPTKLFDGGLTKDQALVAIGIDQSLTGFALSAVSIAEPEKHITWVYKSPYFGIERLADIRQWLIDTLDYVSDGHGIVDIAMEGSVLASHSALVLGELAAVVKMAIYDYFGEDENCRYPLKIPPMTLKKYAAGKGNAKKQEMLMQIYKRWGIEFNDDNAADAYALGRLAGKTANDEIEKAVAKQIEDPKYRDQARL